MKNVFNKYDFPFVYLFLFFYHIPTYELYYQKHSTVKAYIIIKIINNPMFLITIPIQ